MEKLCAFITKLSLIVGKPFPPVDIFISQLCLQLTFHNHSSVPFREEKSPTFL
jgi:hypothetical protein